MSVLLLAAKFGQLKVIDMLWGQLAFDRASKKVCFSFRTILLHRLGHSHEVEVVSVRRESEGI